MLVLNVEVKAISPIRLKSSLSKVQILPKITGNIFHLHVHKSRLFEILDGSYLRGLSKFVNITCIVLFL